MGSVFRAIGLVVFLSGVCACDRGNDSQLTPGDGPQPVAVEKPAEVKWNPDYYFVSDKALAEIPATITGTTIANCQEMTDSGIKHLERLTELEWLSVFDAVRVTDDGGVTLGKLSKLRQLWVLNSGIGDGTLAALKTLPNLRKLELTNCGNITHEGVRHLGQLSSLQELTLGGTDMSGPGLAALKNLPRLRTLVITHVKAENAKYLAELVQLEELSFLGGKITAEVLAPLGTLKNLKTLNLLATDVTSIESIDTLTALEELNLSLTPLTDEGFRGVSKLVNLKQLFVGKNVSSMEPVRDLKNLTHLSVGGEVDDSCVEILVGLPKLKWIGLQDSKVSKDGFLRLKMAFPSAGVYSDHE